MDDAVTDGTGFGMAITLATEFMLCITEHSIKRFN